MKSFVCLILFTVAGLLGCRAEPQRVVVDKEVTHDSARPADSDFALLQYVFERRGGRLYDPARHRSVEWRDYQWFRVYDFGDYSVVVHPFDWTIERFNILLYAGPLPSSYQLVNDMHQVRVGGYETGTNIRGFRHLQLDGSSIDEQNIGIDMSYLGQSCNAYSTALSQSQYNTDRRGLSALSLYKSYRDSLKATGNTNLISYVDYLNHDTAIHQMIYQEVIFENDKAVFLQYVSPAGTGPILGSLAINKPVTTVVNQGVIDLNGMEE